MIVLHGIGTATGRPLWASESRAAMEFVIAGLQDMRWSLQVERERHRSSQTDPCWPL
jgi:hypothetical protein